MSDEGSTFQQPPTENRVDGQDGEQQVERRAEKEDEGVLEQAADTLGWVAEAAAEAAGDAAGSVASGAIEAAIDAVSNIDFDPS